MNNNELLLHLKKITSSLKKIIKQIPSIRTIYENNVIKIVCIPTGYKLHKNDIYIKDLYTACEPIYPEMFLKQSLHTYNEDNDIFVLLYKEDFQYKTVGFMIINTENLYCSDSCFDCSDKNCAYILLFCIDPHYRRKKLGAIFMENIKQEMQRQGKTCIRLTAHDQNNIRTYTRYGFVIESTEYECDHKMTLYL